LSISLPNIFSRKNPAQINLGGKGSLSKINNTRDETSSVQYNQIPQDGVIGINNFNKNSSNGNNEKNGLLLKVNNEYRFRNGELTIDGINSKQNGYRRIELPLSGIEENDDGTFFIRKDGKKLSVELTPREEKDVISDDTNLDNIILNLAREEGLVGVNTTIQGGVSAAFISAGGSRSSDPNSKIVGEIFKTINRNVRKSKEFLGGRELDVIEKTRIASESFKRLTYPKGRYTYINIYAGQAPEDAKIDGRAKLFGDYSEKNKKEMSKTLKSFNVNPNDRNLRRAFAAQILDREKGLDKVIKIMSAE